MEIINLEPTKVWLEGMRKEWHFVLNESIQKFNSNQETLEDCVTIIRFLPSILLEEKLQELVTTNEEEVFTNDEKLFIARKKLGYHTLADWLEKMILGKSGNINLEHGEGIHLRYQAEYHKSMFDLAVEMYPRCPEMQIRWHSPTRCWMSIEIYLARQMFAGSGLLGNFPSKGMSKSELYRKSFDNLRWLDGTDFSSDENFELMEITNPQSWLIAHARNLAKNDASFKCSTAYREYKAKYKALVSYIRHKAPPSLQLSSGKFLLTGRRQPKTKGFGIV